ncbi:MAG: excinuclease ABC subunit UvrA, partial [Fibrobacteria bacterium]|nr:excinuclease ABC subunit UvrA [Fibrobacteria bacterium]
GGFLLNSPGMLKELAMSFKEQGYRRYFIDGDYYDTQDLPPLKHVKFVALVVDRLSLKGRVTRALKTRLGESVEVALTHGNGMLAMENGREALEFYSRFPACRQGHYFLRTPLEPKHFSFNSHWGACEACMGLGHVKSINSTRLITNPDKPLITTAVAGMPGSKIKRKGGYYNTLIRGMLESWGLNEKACFNELNASQKKAFLYGDPEKVHISRRRRRSVSEYSARWKGLIPLCHRWFEVHSTPKWLEEKERLLSEQSCPDCGGGRLKKPYGEVTVEGLNTGDICRMTIKTARDFFNRLGFSKNERLIAEPILREIRGRLNFLASVGLDYLALERTGASLSGGEAQRIQLARQIGAGLEGVMYVLDEPTIGLHQRDAKKLSDMLMALRDLGNTIVVVEHDPEMIRQADWVIDMGPGPGDAGGQVVACGIPTRIQKNRKSITGRYLAGRERVSSPPVLLPAPKQFISLKGACLHNLKTIDVDFPLRRLISCCGVSGSGKSSLIMDVLAGAAEQKLTGKPLDTGLCKALALPKEIQGVIQVDQAPIGNSPRSNPITYGKVFDKIRALFALMPSAKVRGFTKTRFSMNVGKGRCEICEGLGAIKKEMHFISDVWVTCDACKGKRYNTDTLAVEFKGKNIAEVLQMRVEGACDFFSEHPGILKYLDILREVGLGYLRLGQASTTLSGGEAQRVKLASELASASRKRYLYLFDEPTTGLHLADIAQLIKVLRRLVEKGNSVIVIEHQMDFIAASDWILELGPEGGDAGGKLVFSGTPGKLGAQGKTPTGQCLQKTG